MAHQKILVIEDDAAIRRGIADALRFHHYDAIEASDGKDGLSAALQADYDLLLLDLMLPGVGGLEILEAVRKTRRAAPIIILTAKGEEADRVKGLRLGADDYVVKPFGVKELLARIEAVLRRSPDRPEKLGSLRIGGCVIHFDRREAHRGNERIALSERESELLLHLAENRGRAVSREEILSRVWRIDPSGVETRTIDMHIVRLREKLHDDPENPRIIRTVRGKGYLLGETEKP